MSLTATELERTRVIIAWFTQYLSNKQELSETSVIKALQTQLNGVVGGFKGYLEAVDTPIEDGFYIATQSATYTNAGGLIVNLDNGLTFIIKQGNAFKDVVINFLVKKEYDANDDIHPASMKASMANFFKSLAPLFEQKIDKLIPYAGNQGSYNYQSSIFRGWGTGISALSPFNKITLYLNAWNSSNTPTQVRVRIRTNDYNGAILYEEIHSWSKVVNGKLPIILPATINSSDHLWLEYKSDGYLGAYMKLDSGNPAQNSFTRYTTNSDLNSSVNTLLTGNKLHTIIADFELVVDYEIQVKETAVPLLLDKLGIKHDTPRINLPNTLDVIVARPVELFFEGMIEAININNYNIKAKFFLLGKQFNSKFDFTLNTLSPKVFTLELYDNHNRLLTSKSMTVNPHLIATTPATVKKVLFLGDSNLISGFVSGEFLRIMTTSGTPSADKSNGLNIGNIELIGTVDKSSGNKFEAYGGKNWKFFIEKTTEVDVEFTVTSHDKNAVDLVSIWQDSNNNVWKLEAVNSSTLLTFSRVNHTANAPASGNLTHVSGATNTNNIIYTSVLNDGGSAVNKFWNTSTNQLDISNYITTNGFGGLDYVCTYLTWNGLRGLLKDAVDHADLIADAKVFIDKVHSDYPNCKIIIGGMHLPSKNGGLGENYFDGTANLGNYYDLKQTIFGMNLAYQALANDPTYSSFVYFIDNAILFDNINNMPTEKKQVNLSNLTEYDQGANGVHFSIPWQISKSFAMKINSLL
jgi:hypothetical protein